MLIRKSESRVEWTDPDIEKRVKDVSKKFVTNLESLRDKFQKEILSMIHKMDRSYYHYLKDAIKEFNNQCHTNVRINDMLERRITGNDWGGGF